MKEPLLRKDEFSVLSDRANAAIVWPDVMSPDELSDFMEWLAVTKRKIERIASANYAANHGGDPLAQLQSENESLSNRLKLAMDMLGEYVDNAEMMRRLQQGTPGNRP